MTILYKLKRQVITFCQNRHRWYYNYFRLRVFYKFPLQILGKTLTLVSIGINRTTHTKIKMNLFILTFSLCAVPFIAVSRFFIFYVQDDWVLITCYRNNLNIFVPNGLGLPMGSDGGRGHFWWVPHVLRNIDHTRIVLHQKHFFSAPKTVLQRFIICFR